jgi:hypothetical protein
MGASQKARLLCFGRRDALFPRDQGPGRGQMAARGVTLGGPRGCPVVDQVVAYRRGCRVQVCIFRQRTTIASNFVWRSTQVRGFYQRKKCRLIRGETGHAGRHPDQLCALGNDRLRRHQDRAVGAIPVLKHQPLDHGRGCPDQAADPDDHHDGECREIGEPEQIGFPALRFGLGLAGYCFGILCHGRPVEAVDRASRARAVACQAL